MLTVSHTLLDLCLHQPYHRPTPLDPRTIPPGYSCPPSTRARKPSTRPRQGRQQVGQELQEMDDWRDGGLILRCHLCTRVHHLADCSSNVALYPTPEPDLPRMDGQPGGGLSAMTLVSKSYRPLFRRAPFQRSPRPKRDTRSLDHSARILEATDWHPLWTSRARTRHPACQQRGLYHRPPFLSYLVSHSLWRT